MKRNFMILSVFLLVGCGQSNKGTSDQELITLLQEIKGVNEDIAFNSSRRYYVDVNRLILGSGKVIDLQEQKVFKFRINASQKEAEAIVVNNNYAELSGEELLKLKANEWYDTGNNQVAFSFFLVNGNASEVEIEIMRSIW